MHILSAVLVEAGIKGSLLYTAVDKRTTFLNSKDAKETVLTLKKFYVTYTLRSITKFF
jgi:hypothetical protein